MSEQNQLVIVDPALMTKSGHHSALADQVVKGSLGRFPPNTAVSYIVHRDLNFDIEKNLIESNINLIRHFDLDFYYIFEKNVSLLESSEYIFELCNQYTECFLKFKDTNVTYFHPSMSWEHALALALALFQMKANNRIKHVVCLMFNPGIDYRGVCYDSDLSIKYQIALKSLMEAECIEIYVTDFESQLSYSNLLFKESFEIHPSYVVDLNSSKEICLQSDRYIILYLGEAKLEKGFDKLPDLLLELLKNSRLHSTFYIQYTDDWGGSEIKEIVSKIKSIEKKYSNVVVDGCYIDDDAMTSLLLSAQCVFFNYDEEIYKNKSSGLLWKACAADAPVVLFNDRSWLYRESSRLKATVFMFGEAFSEELNKPQKFISCNDDIYGRTIFGDFIFWLKNRLF
ncbi:hypothetical protein NBRC116591_16050 [Sessilibacter corallicola]|uniref:Glycosyl transferase family 1 domain-containing protein n=2 Tax=Sessilibacter corallicola TaxID=2904075 RepID=A0ABQ0A820_9GAMM